MKELLDKLSSYNVFNYLLPGIVFSVLGDALTSFQFVQKDVFTGAFIYYFIGLIISRVGSLAIEPALKRLNFIQFSEYSDFVEASKKDKMISILSEANNMYRTFCSVFFSLAVIKIYEITTSAYPILNQWSTEFIVIALLLLFMFSYRKQTQYIVKRVSKALNKD